MIRLPKYLCAHRSTRHIGTLERPMRAFPRWSVGTIKNAFGV